MSPVMRFVRIGLTIVVVSVTANCLADRQTDALDAEALCDGWASAATGEDALAKRNLAYCFWTGEGREKNLKGAEELLRQSAALGDATAMYDLGTLLTFEQVFRGHYRSLVPRKGGDRCPETVEIDGSKN